MKNLIKYSTIILLMTVAYLTYVFVTIPEVSTSSQLTKRLMKEIDNAAQYEHNLYLLAEVLRISRFSERPNIKEIHATAKQTYIQYVNCHEILNRLYGTCLSPDSAEKYFSPLMKIIDKIPAVYKETANVKSNLREIHELIRSINFSADPKMCVLNIVSGFNNIYEDVFDNMQRNIAACVMGFDSWKTLFSDSIMNVVHNSQLKIDLPAVMKLNATERLFLNIDLTMIEGNCFALKNNPTSRADDHCKLEIRGGGFTVNIFDKPTQTVTNLESPMWVFDLTPKTTGVQRLTVHISYRYFDAGANTFKNGEISMPYQISVID